MLLKGHNAIIERLPLQQEAVSANYCCLIMAALTMHAANFISLCTNFENSAVVREAISVLNQTFSELRLEKHTDKTFIERIEEGFDFLGYYFSSEGFQWLKGR